MGITDGRDSRWVEYRAVRRRELVEESLRAIRRYGAGVGMDEIAAQAGTSKTVIYRYFGDRAGLYSAVVDAVHTYIHDDLTATLQLTASDDLPQLTANLANAYFALVERDPEIYRFVMSRPLVDGDLTDDPVTGLTMRIGERMADILRSRGYDADLADTWGHALVGAVRAATDQWIRSGMHRPADDVAGDLAALVGPAFNLVTTINEEHR